MTTALATVSTLRTEVRAPGAKRILAAYDEAMATAETATQKALICGQLLREQRDSLIVCHDGRRSDFRHNGRGRAPENQFELWLTRECPQIPARTAYRWMKAAERVDRVLQLSEAVDIEATPISVALAGAEGSEGSKVRQLWFDFTQDKTLADCLRDVIEGESPDHRIARAYNGAHAAGAGGGGDRKKFEQFAALKLQHITTFLRAKLSTNQKALILSAFNRALEVWPRWLLDGLAEKCREELKLSDEERAARTEF